MISISVLRTAEEKAAAFAGQLDRMEQDLVYFTRDTMAERSYIAARDGARIIGLVCLRELSSLVPGATTVTFVAVEQSRRNQGVSKLMVEAIFEFARSLGRSLVNTRYDEDGRKFLKPILERAAARHPDVFFQEHPTC